MVVVIIIAVVLRCWACPLSVYLHKSRIYLFSIFRVIKKLSPRYSQSRPTYGLSKADWNQLSFFHLFFMPSIMPRETVCLFLIYFLSPRICPRKSRIFSLSIFFTSNLPRETVCLFLSRDLSKKRPQGMIFIIKPVSSEMPMEIGYLFIIFSLSPQICPKKPLIPFWSFSYHLDPAKGHRPCKKNKFSLQKGVVHLCFLVGLTSAQSNRLWFLCICSYHKLARRNQLSCSEISFYLKLAKANAVLPLTQCVLEETPPPPQKKRWLPSWARRLLLLSQSLATGHSTNVGAMNPGSQASGSGQPICPSTNQTGNQPTIRATMSTHIHGT